MMLSMEFWWVGLLTYALGHAVHMAWWRLVVVRGHLRTLLVIFLAPVFAFWAVVESVGFFNWNEIAAPLLTHLSLTAQYIAIYPAFQATSPTLELLEMVASSGGMTRANILARFAGQSVLEARILDLETGRLVKRTDHGLELTLSGRLLAQIFIGYRALLRLPLGDG